MRTSLLILFLALAMPVTASAQDSEPEPLEPVIADSNVLSTSLRGLERGLRQPVGFDRVYANPEGGYMRISGGLYATFPQSAYQSSRGRSVAVVPANTTFYIGRPPTGPADEAAPPPPPSAVNSIRSTRMDTRVGPDGIQPGVGVGRPVDLRPEGPPPISARASARMDPEARRRRLERLMQRAATAEMRRRRDD